MYEQPEEMHQSIQDELILFHQDSFIGFIKWTLVLLSKLAKSRSFHFAPLSPTDKREALNQNRIIHLIRNK